MADDSDNFVIKVDVENVNKAVSDLQKVERAEKQADVTNKKLSKSVDGLGASFASAAKKILAAAASYAVLKVSMKTFFDLANQGQKVFENSTLFGLDSGGIQRMAQASRQFGGNLEGVSRTVRSLRQQLVGLRFGEQNGVTEAMRLFGLNITNEDGSLKNYEELLDSIALRMETLAPEFQEALANLLGLDPGTFGLVRQGFEKYREYLDSQKPVFSEAFVKSSNDFKKAWVDATNELTKFGGNLGEELLPKITRVTNEFTKWLSLLNDSKEVLKNTSDVVSKTATAMGRIWDFAKLAVEAYTSPDPRDTPTEHGFTGAFKERKEKAVQDRIKAQKALEARYGKEMVANYMSDYRLDIKSNTAFDTSKNGFKEGDNTWPISPDELEIVNREFIDLGSNKQYYRKVLAPKDVYTRKQIREAIAKGQKYYSIPPGEGLDSDLGFINALSDIPIDAARPGDVNNDNSKSTTIQFIFDGIEVQRIENNGIPTEEELIDVSAEAIKTAWNSVYFLDGNDGRVS